LEEILIIQDGFQTWEFYWPHEQQRAGTEVASPSREGALSWLMRIHHRHSDFIFRIRRFLDGHTPLACYHLSDPEVLAEAASLLQSRRLKVVLREQPIRFGSAPSAPPQQTFVPFPLPARRPPAPAAPIQENDEATFSDVDFAAQAAVLVAAANSGAAFCPE
jgi:hypothetical protein